MIVFRPATFSDVEHIHKLLNYYAKEGLMLPRARNAIYENLRDYILAVEITVCWAAVRCILSGTALRKSVRWRWNRACRKQV